jgi:molybdate transport system substrate-binding protein
LILFNKLFSCRALAALVMLAMLMAVPRMAQAQPRERVTIYAATSLKEALDAVLKLREAQRRSTVQVVYAASSTLARQIERGAPADVFISADTDWMDYLSQRKLLREGTRVNLLTNRLVLIVPANSASDIAIGPRFALAAALGNGRLAMADPDSVPAGKYAKAALIKLGVWGEVSRKIASTENVRAALALVARGEVPFGIVYASDTVAERKVRVQGEFPAHLHAPVVYPAALLAQSRAGDAQPLLGDLRSAEAQALWRKHGFGVVE